MQPQVRPSLWRQWIVVSAATCCRITAPWDPRGAHSHRTVHTTSFVQQRTRRMPDQRVSLASIQRESHVRDWLYTSSTSAAPADTSDNHYVTRYAGTRHPPSDACGCKITAKTRRAGADKLFPDQLTTDYTRRSGCLHWREACALSALYFPSKQKQRRKS